MSLTKSDADSVPENIERMVGGTCLAHGDYEVPEIFLFGKIINRNPPCPRCIYNSNDQRQIEVKTREAAVLKARLLEVSGIQKRMLGKQLQDFVPPNPTAAAHLKVCQDIIDNWPESEGKHPNLILSGNVGTGKTLLICAVGQELINQYCVGVIYTTMAEMARHVMERFGDRQYTQSQAIERYAKVPLLLVDEVGVDSGTDFVRRTLTEIVDKRYGRRLPTFLSSNLTVSEILKATDQRVIDRLRENGTVLTFDWKSYR